MECCEKLHWLLAQREDAAQSEQPTKEAVEEVLGLKYGSVCVPQFWQPRQGKAVKWEPVSMITDTR